MGSDEGVEVLDGRGREFDARHWLQLVERDRLAGVGLLATELRALKRARDDVEEIDNIAGVGIGVIQRAGQQRASDRPGLDVHAIRKPRELLGLLILQRDVESFHELYGTRKGTVRVPGLDPRTALATSPLGAVGPERPCVAVGIAQ